MPVMMLSGTYLQFFLAHGALCWQATLTYAGSISHVRLLVMKIGHRCFSTMLSQSAPI
jgi:hypothetical protein